MNLLTSQASAFQKLSSLRVGALFMEAGTGKTLATIKIINSIEGERQVFWFTPFQTKTNLRTEINKWGRFDCEIYGIESLSNSDRLYLQLFNKIRKSWNPVIIVDESLKIKNSDAKRTQRLIDLGKMATHKLILNGTPLSRNLLDLWPQMEFLSPNILKMTEAQFKNHFCEYVTMTYRSPGYGRSYSREFIKRYHNLDYLYTLIEPYIFESKLSINVGMQHIDLSYTLTNEEMSEHDRLKEKYLDDRMLMARKNNIFLELTQKMQHNYSCSPEKFELVDTIIKDENPEKILIYAKYIDTQERLKKEYPGIRIMSLGKHAYGLNLQAYNRIIHFDKTWDYAQREQVSRRIYRQGQQDDCIEYDLTANVGLDTIMNASIEKKATLLQMFKTLTTEELKKVL